MKHNGVTTLMIQKVVASRGWFPLDMPVKDYPEDFISDMLVGGWENLMNEIQLPF